MAPLAEKDVRTAKVEALRQMGIQPFAQSFDKKQTMLELQEKGIDTKNLADADRLLTEGGENTYTTAGRIMMMREHGKLSFAKCRDVTGDMQFCLVKGKVKLDTGKEIIQEITTPEGLVIDIYKFVQKYIDVGDFIGVRGDLFVTKHGELTLFVNEVKLLTKAIRPLPEKFHGLKDEESCYRQRYLDLTMNEATYQRFLLRSNFLRTVRDFYHKHAFVEVETSVLGNAASGAAAAPFVTHHNDFDLDMYLRISPETALKKLTAGRFERVFEVAKDFRNEGTDPSHHQEFTMIEHYAAFRNYKDNMLFTEHMFDYVFSQMPTLQKKIQVADKEGVMKEVNFTTPRARVDYIEQVKKDSGIDVSLYTEGDDEKLRAAIFAAGYKREGIEKQGLPTMIDYLYKKVTRPKIVGPAFIYNYPKTMQPLARVSDENNNIVEQWQLLVNGREIIKAYSELVDPLLQQENFDAQADAIAKGDEEATKGDEEFVLAMEHGMPCQSGRGMGVDRILAMLLGQTNIRDVILFPLMKPESGTRNEEKGERDGKDKAKETKLAIALINKGADLVPWQEMNTIAHLNAAFGARGGRKLFMQDTITTKDEQSINLNIQHAIMIKTIASSQDILVLLEKANKKNLEIAEFTREMLNTTDDRKVAAQTKEKNLTAIEHLGVLLFGPKKDVEELTKEFALYT